MTAAEILLENGYDAVVMRGMRSWEASGKPVASEEIVPQ